MQRVLIEPCADRGRPDPCIKYSKFYKKSKLNFVTIYNMSADNGIYIAKFKDGYKVAYAQAIENVFECKEWLEFIFSGKSYKTYKGALDCSIRLRERLFKDHWDLEYGIVDLGEIIHE
jgi:glutathionyl-hydroquinone reductase